MKGGLQGWKAQKSILLRARCAGRFYFAVQRVMRRYSAINVTGDLTIEVEGSRHYRYGDRQIVVVDQQREWHGV